MAGGWSTLPVTLEDPVYSFGLALVTTFDVTELKGDLNVVWSGIGSCRDGQINSNQYLSICVFTKLQAKPIQSFH